MAVVCLMTCGVMCLVARLGQEGMARSADNPFGAHEFGVSDLLLQGLLIRPLKQAALVFGAQFLFPTASQEQFGAGKFQLVPTGAAVVYPGWLSKGSFVGGLVRYTFDIGGDDDRPHIAQLALQPLLNLALPAHWFVTLAPELKLDLRQDGAVFFPFDITVGKLITRTLVASVECKHKLVDDFTQFDWSVEARLGVFF